MERVPRKPEKKRIKKSVLLTLLLGVLLLAAAGVYFLRRPQVPALPEREEKMALLKRSQAEITSLAITPREGLSYPLIRGEQGFVFLGREDMALRDSVINDMLEVADTLTAEETLLDTAEEKVDLADFGLQPPAVRVVITYQDGERAEWRIGGDVPDDTPKKYCMMGNDSRLYAVLASQCEPFTYELDYLRAFDQPQVRAELLDRIDISGDLSFGAYYTPSGWIMDMPFRYPLAVQKMQALLQQISGMGFEAYLGAPQEVDLAAYGLDHPALTVVLTQAETVVSGETEEGESVSFPVPVRQYTLQLGHETGKSGVYLMWENQVYKASNFLMGFWKQLSPAALLLRQPVNFLTNDLTRIAFSAGDVHREYEVRMVESVTENNQIAVDEYGNTLYDCAVRRAGEERDVDAGAFLNWYAFLAGITPAGQVPEGYEPGGAEKARITLESQSLTRTIVFTPFDALHDAMTVDGVCLYYVDGGWLEEAIKLPD